MTPGEVVDIALLRVASAAEDVVAVRSGEKWMPVSAACMFALTAALDSLRAARTEYLRSTGQADRAVSRQRCECGHTTLLHAGEDGAGSCGGSDDGDQFCGCLSFVADRAVSK